MVLSSAGWGSDCRGGCVGSSSDGMAGKEVDESSGLTERSDRVTRLEEIQDEMHACVSELKGTHIAMQQQLDML